MTIPEEDVADDEHSSTVQAVSCARINCSQEAWGWPQDSSQEQTGVQSAGVRLRQQGRECEDPQDHGICPSGQSAAVDDGGLRLSSILSKDD
jgi:hypothetical protein